MSDLERGVHPSARRSTVEALATALGLAGAARDEFLDAAVPEARRALARPRLPRALARAERRSVLRGRDAELQVLHDAWQVAEKGEAGLVTITGAAGMGKTRLLADLAHCADTNGAAVLFARCDEALAEPYHAFVQLLREYVDALGPSTVVAHDPRDAAHLATLLPDLPVAPAGHTTRADLFDAIARTIERCSQSAPCLLLLDDMQHADRATLHVLRYVMRANAEHRLLTVLAYRGYEVEEDATLRTVLAELGRDLPVTRLQLLGIDPTGVADVVADHLGRPFPALARALHRDAAGNPLFVSEYLAHLGELGKVDELAWRQGADVFEDAGLPSGVRDVLASRVEEVDPDVRDVLGYGAVVGVEFDVHLVAAMASLSDDEVYGHVDKAVTAGLVLEDDAVVGRWHFAQPLFRSVLLADMTNARRARLQQRVVDVLEHCGDDSPETLELLAYHSTQTHQLPGMAERAVNHAVKAARNAARVFAWERVASWYERAVTVLDAHAGTDPETLCDVLLLLGDARVRALERQHAMPVFLRAAEVADRIGSDERLALAAIGYGYMAKAEIADERARALWGDALARTDDPALRAMLMAARATHMTFAGDDHDARATTEAALELARKTSDVRALALALAGRSIALWGSPCSETRRRLAQELAATGILANNDEWLLDGIELVGVPLLELALVDDFDRVVDDLAVAGRRTGRASSIAQATQWAAMRALMRGDVDTARTLARHVIDVAENAPNFLMGWAAQQYVADRAVGRHDALLPAIAEFAARHRSVIAWRAAYARALVEAGRPDDAQTLLTDIVEHLPGSPRTWTWVAALVVGAETAARLADASAAAAIEPLLAPYAGRLAVVASGTSCEGAVDRYLGLLAATQGDVDRAAARFRAALAFEEHADAPALAMRTRLDVAALLRRRGGRAAADAARRQEAAAHEFGAASGLEATAALPW